MSRPDAPLLRSLRTLALCSLLAALLVLPVRAQGTDIRVLESDDRGKLVEFRVSWSLSLRQTLDSLGSSVLDARTAGAITRGWFTTSESIDLPSHVLPTVRIVTSDFEEVQLGALFEEEDEWIGEQLARPAARAEALGIERRRSVVALAFQPVTYDASTQTLRRYKRIVARVDYGSRRDLTVGPAAMAASARLSVQQSVLADGVVFKFPIHEEGIYRIDYEMLQQMLASVNMNVADVHAGELRIFGNGGEPLPALNSAPRPIDLIENPVEIVGGAGGRFNQGDALLFHARGPSGWTYTADGNWEHYRHPFSNANYYFLKIGGDGRRVQSVPAPQEAAMQTFTSVDGRIFEQRDEIMWSKGPGSGKTWVSRRIESSGELRIFDNRTIPDMMAGPLKISAHTAIRSNPRTAVRFYDGGTFMGRILASRFVGDGELSPSAASSMGSFEVNGAGGRLNVAMRLESTAGSPSAALDWMRVIYPQRLQPTNGQLRFATPGGHGGVLQFDMTGFSQTPRVWDVSEPGNIRALTVESVGDLTRLKINVSDERYPREIVAFTDQATRTLRSALAAWSADFSPVPAQNLHGIAHYPEFVIITPDEFRQAAERLADHRRAEGMDVLVTDIRQIYNEFSGGVPDMRAVRDYLKFLFDRGPGDEPALRYALFFGDGTFNFRGIPENGQPPVLTNWIFPYQTRDSFDPIRSYTSDDYFGLLSDAEGEWSYPGDNAIAPPGGVVERMDIAVGRFPVQTAREADIVVQKVIDYESPQTFGKWRSRYTFLADDHLTGIAGGREEYDLHTQNADAVAELVETTYPRVNVKKIYAESYQREFINGWRIPDARRDVLSTINDGTLLFNFSGHGNIESLMQEQVFTRADIQRLTNRDRLSIFVTATCEFGRWDLSDRQSAGEDLLLHEHGGAVAMLSTVRLVFTSSNIFSLNPGLNREMSRNLLLRGEDGRARRVGDAYRITKNTHVGLQGNNRKFNLLGDPTMRIGLPASDVTVERVNDVALGENEAPLRALERVTLSGAVLDRFGSVDTSFDGFVDVTVFDAERRVPLVDQRYMTRPYYTMREDLIWRGTSQADGGRFEATFVVPKDISYRNEMGRISAYAYSGDHEALGYSENVRVGGTAPNPTVDLDGPDIRLFLNDTTFVSGGMVPSEPLLMVKLFDESGINTVGSGVGHEMLLTLNDDEQSAVDLSRYYQAEAGSYQRGTVQYRIDRPLREGMNTLSVRAWDVANNSSTETIDFFVSENEALTLRNVFNYPNPTSGRTRFIFEHNQAPGTSARVQVRIYTINGRAIRTINSDEALPGGVLTGHAVQIPWDGRDDDLGTLASGIYLYRLRVEVDGTDGEQHVSEHIDRIALIR